MSSLGPCNFPVALGADPSGALEVLEVPEASQAYVFFDALEDYSQVTLRRWALAVALTALWSGGFQLFR